MDDSSFLRAKSDVASSKSMFEISRLSEKLQVENSKVKLLAQQYNRPADIVLTLGAYFGLSCMCFLRHGQEWSVTTAADSRPTLDSIESIFAPLASHEIYVDRKGLLSSDILLTADLRRVNSKDMIFVSISETCIWTFFGRESGSVVLTIEQQPQWRDLMDAASSLIAGAVERSSVEKLLEEKAATGDLLCDICYTLMGNKYTASNTALSEASRLLRDFLQASSCDIFMSEDLVSCVDTRGSVLPLAGLAREAFITRTVQLCHDMHSAKRSFQIDNGSSGAVQSIVVIPMWQSDELSAVMVLRFAEKCSDATVFRGRSIADRVSPILQRWVGSNMHSIPSKTSVDHNNNQLNSSNETLSVLSFLSNAVSQILKVGHKELECRRLQSYVAKSLDCEWAIILHANDVGFNVYDDGDSRVVTLDDVKGQLNDAIRSALSRSQTHIVNSMDGRQSGLQTLLRRPVNGLINICVFPLTTSLIVIAGRCWRSFSHTQIQPLVECLSSLYETLSASRSLSSESNSIEQVLRSEVDIRDKITEAAENFDAKIKSAAISSAVDFRISFLSAMRSYCANIITSDLIAFGGLPYSKFMLSPKGVWERDLSYVRSDDEDILQTYSNRSRRFLLTSSESCGVRLSVVLVVSAIVGSFSQDKQHISAASAFTPRLATAVVAYRHKLFSCPIEGESISLAIDSSLLVEQLRTKGHFSIGDCLLEIHHTSLSSVVSGNFALIVNKEGRLVEFAYPHRVMPSIIERFVNRLLEEKKEDSVEFCSDFSVVDAISEHFSIRTNSEPNIFAFHSFTSKHDCTVINIVIYDCKMLVTPWHIGFVQQHLFLAAKYYSLLDSLNPHLVSSHLFTEIEMREKAQRLLADQLSKLYGIMDNASTASDYELSVYSANIAVQMTDSALSYLLGACAKRGLYELISNALRAAVRCIFSSSKREILSDEDVVVKWFSPIIHKPRGTEIHQHDEVTIGLISPDMVELVRSSGKSLELDFQSAGLKYRLDSTGSAKSKNQRVSYTPIFKAMKVGGDLPIVNAVLQFVGNPAPTSEEPAIMKCLQRLLSQASEYLRPTVEEVNSYINHLEVITKAISSSSSVTELDVFFRERFDDAFSTYCCSSLQSDCAYFSSSNANFLAGNYRAVALHWTEAGAVNAPAPISISVETLDSLSEPFSVFSHSILGNDSNIPVYVMKLPMEEARLDDSESSASAYFIIEKMLRPSFYEMNQINSLLDMRRLILLAALSLSRRMRVEQQLQFESFCRNLSKCEDFHQAKTLVEGDLAESLNCFSVTLILLSPTPLLTGFNQVENMSHSHSSRSNDERMADRCLLGGSHVDCRQGTLSSPAPSIFIPVYNFELVEETPFEIQPCALKMCFADTQSFDSFLASENHRDSLQRYLERGLEAANCLKTWIEKHELITRITQERGVIEGLKHLSKSISEIFGVLPGSIANVSESLLFLNERSESESSDFYLFNPQANKLSNVYSLPSLSAYLADIVENLKQENQLIGSARLHWISPNESIWQTCQRSEEIDEKLYLRLNVDVNYVQSDVYERIENVSAVKPSSPSRRSNSTLRSWVRSRSNMSIQLSKAIANKLVVVTRNFDINHLEVTEEVLWLWVDSLNDGHSFILELRVRNNMYTSLTKPLKELSLEGLHGTVYFASRSSLLFSKMRLVQQIFSNIIASVLRIDGEVTTLQAERAHSRIAEMMVETLDRCINGFFAPKGEEGAPLKSSLEAVLSELCKFGNVKEVHVECVDQIERSLLFKSVVKSSSSRAPKSHDKSWREDASFEALKESFYIKEYNLDHRDIKGNMAIYFSTADNQLTSLHSVDLYDTIAKAIARRAYELNKVRKNKAALKRKIEDLGLFQSQLLEMENNLAKASRDQESLQNEVEALVEKNHVAHEQLAKAKEDVAKAVREKNAMEFKTQQSVEHFFEEGRKKKAQLMHSVSILEGDVTKATEDLMKVTLEKEQALQNLAIAEMRLNDAREDHEHMLKSLQAYKSKKAKESTELQRQCNALLAKLSVTENELLGTRKLFDHKRAAVDELKISLAAAQSELIDLKHRLNLA